MSDTDREKWNTKYRSNTEISHEPSTILTAINHLIPRHGNALDMAGGDGRNSVWLAERGLDVTVADISEAGLSLARKRASEHGIMIQTRQVDLEINDILLGPWDVIISILYLYRPLLREIPKMLCPGGTLVVVQPTRTNLERHAHPSAKYLLDDGELPSLIQGLEIVHYEEGWLADGRHDALLVANRPPESDRLRNCGRHKSF